MIEYNEKILGIDSFISNDILESSNSRIYSWFKTKDCAIITAFSDSNTREENMRRNQELRETLIKFGYSITSVKGVFIEDFGTKNEVLVEENS